MANENDETRGNIKRALLTVLVRLMTEGTPCDEEDRAVMVRYHISELTEQEFYPIMRRKGELLSLQNSPSDEKARCLTN
jgi:hypothetical protein